MPDAAIDASATTLQRLGGVITTLRSQMTHGARRLEEAVGLPAAQVAALRAVDDGAGSVNGVAERLLTHASSASRTIDALVRADLVDRTPDQEDRRSVVLEVTAAGHERLGELDRHRDRLLTRAMEGLSPEERLVFVGLLERFVDGLSDA